MKTFCSHSVAITALVSCLVVSSPARTAHADPSATDKSTATQLFKEGRALLEAGHVSAACRKLEESQRLDPGGGTLLNLALCHEQEGRTATAWVEFTEALGIAKRDDRPQRVEFARMHIAQLEPSLSRLVIEVPPVADVPDLEIRRDDSIVGRAAWGSPVPVDPGDHVIEVSATGKIPWKEAVVIAAKGDSKAVTIPALDDAPSVSGPAESSGAQGRTPAVRAATPADAPPSAPARDEAKESGSLAPAWIALGVGVAAAGVGTYFALHALSAKNDADLECHGNVCPAAQGVSDNDDAIRSANFATASFVVAALGVGVGAVLFATHSSPHASSASTRPPTVAVTAGDLSLGPGRGEFTVSGRW
ncbi:MAG TPA: hypothetical protein VGM06_05940 [Polyangiaceae bacterium]|jgi:hypothetical protein